MELDQLKGNWNKHNILLKKNIELNEKVLKNMKLDKAKGALKIPYVAELFALIFLLVGALIWAFQIYKLKENILYLGLGALFLIVLLGGALIAWIKLKSILRIDFYNSTVLKLQEDLAMVKKTVIQMIPYEVLLAIGIFVCFPVVFKVTKGKELLELQDSTSIYSVLAVCGLIIAPLALWLIPKLYVSKIKDASERLNEIKNFRSESE